MEKAKTCFLQDKGSQPMASFLSFLVLMRLQDSLTHTCPLPHTWGGGACHPECFGLLVTDGCVIIGGMRESSSVLFNSPLKNSQLYGSPWSHTLSLRRRGTGLCRSTGSYGPESILPINTNSVNMSRMQETKEKHVLTGLCFHFYVQVVTIVQFMWIVQCFIC